MNITDAIIFLEEWQREAASRSIETVNNATDGTISAWAVSLEYGEGPPSKVYTRRCILAETREQTMIQALIMLAHRLQPNR